MRRGAAPSATASLSLLSPLSASGCGVATAATPSSCFRPEKWIAASAAAAASAKSPPVARPGSGVSTDSSCCAASAASAALTSRTAAAAAVPMLSLASSELPAQSVFTCRWMYHIVDDVQHEQMAWQATQQCIGQSTMVKCIKYIKAHFSALPKRALCSSSFKHKPCLKQRDSCAVT
jgi:hypothetical protein